MLFNPFIPKFKPCVIRMKAYEQYFYVVLYKVFIIFVTIQMKTIEQYFHVVLFIMLYKVVNF